VDLTGGRRSLHNNDVHVALSLVHIIESGNNSAGIATCYGPDGPVFESARGKDFCLFFQNRPHWAWGPPSLIFNGYREVKQPGCNTDTCAEFKNKCSYTSIPLHDFCEGQLYFV
jgi:hypothetical protein